MTRWQTITPEQLDRRRKYARHYMCKWRRANQEKVKQANRNTYLKHRQKRLSQCREYHHSNRDRIIAYQRLRRLSPSFRAKQRIRDRIWRKRIKNNQSWAARRRAYLKKFRERNRTRINKNARLRYALTRIKSSLKCRRWRATHPQHMREYNNYVINSDKHVRRLLAHDTTCTPEDFPPELVEVKKAQLTLHRLIRAVNHNTKWKQQHQSYQ